MSANNKALIIMVAVVALAIGAFVNRAQVDQQVDTRTLLRATLLDDSADGQPAVVGDSLSSLTLINFWASWCAPCREEMPIFEAMSRRSRAHGFEVIGIAIDSPEKARPMLDSMDISYPILYAESTGMQLMESAGNPQGLLPYSLLLDKDGDVLEQVLGTIHEEDIDAWIRKYL